MTTTQLVLVTPKNQISIFASASDRAYFSNPVAVNFVRKDEQGLIWVTDSKMESPYPVNPKNLKPHYNLTNREKAALQS